MISKHVLVLGNHSRQLLPDILKDLGFVPELRGSVLDCLAHLHCQSVAAVVVDRDFTHADVLEFLLNIKDIACAVPVIIVGRKRHDCVEQALHMERQAVFINESKNEKRLALEMENILVSNLPKHL
jgi:DNA-binding NtrC family response regulator